MFQAGKRRQKTQRIRGRVSVAITRDSCTDTKLNSSQGNTVASSASPAKDGRGSTRSALRQSSSNPRHQIDLIDCTSPSEEETSLASWLQPLSASNSRAPSSKRPRVRDREDKGGGESSPLPTRAWADLSNTNLSREGRGKAKEKKCNDSLSAWLEPRRPSGKKGRRVDGLSKGEGVLSPSEEPSEKEGEGPVDEDWMSARLEGLDPAGAARAKDGWTDRSKRNLTITDIALGANRKTQGSRGWRTTPSGGRIFVAPSRGGPAVVASGQAAFRMSMVGRKK